jgi:mRNA (guanine-N7-)-methyltransferase
VLDIGCGRGQDIPKWKLARVSYMVAIDFSEECIRSYEERWRNAREPYRLHTIVQDFTSKDLYNQIEHSFYDIVSAQLCFHYMFSTAESLNRGLMTILSNLVIDGAFIATIPDSYTILRKIKEKGVAEADGSRVYGNKYFSIKFKDTKFVSPYGNMYGFYLDQAIGKKNQDGTIEYTNEWLIELDSLSKTLEHHGVVIEETLNFLEYYKKYREEFKDLFPKFKLVFNAGESMDPELWEIAHLYRVLVCRKKTKGKYIHEFDLKRRQESITKELKGSQFNRSTPYNPSHRQHHHSNGRPNDRSNDSRGNHHRSRDNSDRRNRHN